MDDARLKRSSRVISDGVIVAHRRQEGKLSDWLQMLEGASRGGDWGKKLKEDGNGTSRALELHRSTFQYLIRRLQTPAQARP
jgi:hypothetical protein